MRMLQVFFLPLFCAMATISMISMPGCSAYQLQGVVVEGPQPGVYLVRSDDARLKNVAVADARIMATLDPDKLRSKQLPWTMSDDLGRFAIPVDEPGAGLLEYSVSIYADAIGYSDAGVDVMALPGAGKKLLIVLSAGRSKRTNKPGEQSTEDLLREADKFKKQFE